MDTLPDGPRVQAFNAHYYRKVGLDSTIFARSRRALERALRGQQLTRAELAVALRRAGIPADGIRLAYLMMHAELEQVICSGPLRGRQFTYALLDERAPHARTLSRAEALTELTRRYFSSRGPATLKDYVWWSGLTAREAKTGIDIVMPALVQEVIDGRTYWSAASTPRAPRAPSSAHLLPNYDEYLIAGRDRAHIAGPPGTIVFDHHVVIDGQLAGSWTRTVTAQSVSVDVDPYRRLSKADIRTVAAAADRYSQFMNRPVTLALH